MKRLQKQDEMNYDPRKQLAKPNKISHRRMADHDDEFHPSFDFTKYVKLGKRKFSDMNQARRQNN